MGEEASTRTLVFDVLGTLLDEDAGQLAAAAEVVAGPAPRISSRAGRRPSTAR